MGKRGRNKILTLYITKDKETFNKRNYLSVKHQRNVKQDIYIVSASSVNAENNIVVKPPKNYPVPIRVAYSINKAIFKLLKKGVKLEDYNYIFKIDGDVLLPPSYLESMIKEKPIVAGKGAAMLMSTLFYRVSLKGLYPVKHCDDGYIIARAISLGFWPPYGRSSSQRIYIPDYTHFKDREFIYGIEYHKWGVNLKFFIIWMMASIIQAILNSGESRNSIINEVSKWMWNLSGLIYAKIKREKKYCWHKSFIKYRTHHLIKTYLKRTGISR